jgi:hypothetical protein
LISVIVCSVNRALMQQLRQNIDETIGVVYEIIEVDNASQNKSISAVYNMAAESAAFDLLCFVHEDVRIHSSSWGRKLKTLLSDERIGLVGVSGSVYKSQYAGTWSSCDKSFYRTHSIQWFPGQKEPIATCINPTGKAASEVAVIDGVFMATRKDVFNKLQFDEVNFDGFHGYDLDYSLAVGLKYKVVVSFEILLEHFSSGQLNRQWLEASILLHKKWKRGLPYCSEPIDKKAADLSDYLSCAQVLMISIRNSDSRRLVTGNYLRLMTRFFRFNRFKHSKTVLKYLFSKRRNGKEGSSISFS